MTLTPLTVGEHQKVLMPLAGRRTPEGFDTGLGGQLYCNCNLNANSNSVIGICVLFLKIVGIGELFQLLFSYFFNYIM